MNFKEATDGLFDRIDHTELAEALGVSVASVRQAQAIEIKTKNRERIFGGKAWRDTVC